MTLTALGAKRAATDLVEGAVALTYGDLFNGIPQDLLHEPETTRRQDFIFHNPFVKEWRYRIHLPPGFAPRELPEGRNLKLGSMRYEERFEVKGGVIHADLRLDSGLRRLTPEQVKATRQGLDDLGQSDVTILFLDHQGAAHLAAGRSREAVQVYHRLAEAHPESAVHRVRLAKALLDLGMGEEARHQARLATEVEPSSALAHWILGFSLTHDALGRPHGPGFDLLGALEALNKAHELDPSSPLFLAELAILLEFNADGERYGPGADLEKAVTVYQTWRQTFELPNLDENLLNLLYRAGRWEDLKDLAEDLPDTTEGKEIWRLTAVAALEGANAAVRAVGRLGGDRRAQALLLAEASDRLIAVGRFHEAGQMMLKIAHSSDNPASTRRQAELLLDVQPVSEVRLPEMDPTTPALRFFALLLKSDIDLEPVQQLFYPRADDAFFDAEDLTALPRLLRLGLHDQNLYLSPENLGALLLATLEMGVEGDDTVGYRIRIRSKFPSVPMDQVCFVQVWQGDYRLVTVGEVDLAPIADAALRHLDAGRPDAAAQWLDWARELLPSSSDGDPLVHHVFLDAWPGRSRSAANAAVEPDAARMRQAALLLKVTEEQGMEQTVAALDELLAAQPPNTDTEYLLRHGLFQAHWTAENWSHLAEQARWMHQVHPESSLALDLWIRSLEADGQEDTLSQLAATRLASQPDDALAHLILAEQHLRRGAFDAALKAYGKAIQNPDEEQRAAALNTLAWVLLFTDPQHEDILSLAQQSADLNGYQSYDILHTLAMAYAEQEQPLEAIQVLLTGIQRRGDDTVIDADWLVLGRIAQSYGLSERAREIYQRLEEPEEPQDRVSSWHLAQLRLAELNQ